LVAAVVAVEHITNLVLAEELVGQSLQVHTLSQLDKHTPLSSEQEGLAGREVQQVG
jgi:hypothetical protein